MCGAVVRKGSSGSKSAQYRGRQRRLACGDHAVGREGGELRLAQAEQALQHGARVLAQAARVCGFWHRARSTMSASDKD